MNRIIPLLASPSTRYLIAGSKDSVDLYKELKHGNKLIALNVSKSHYSDEVIKVISSLFLMKIWTGILNGFRSSPEKISTYIVIDEFQSIPASIIEILLREGRKFGIKVILASQFIESGTKELIHSVFGNVRNFIAFNLSDEDAWRFAKMSPYSGNARDILKTVKEQKLHTAIVISQTVDGPAGPLSFRPTYSKVELNAPDIEKKKLESLLKYSSEIVVEPRKVAEKTLHEKILDALETTLHKEKVEISRSARTNRSIADASFSYKGKEYIVEVEVSDLSRKYRVLSKLKSYPGRNIILICPEGSGETLHNMITNPTKFRIKDGLALEFPLTDGEMELYTRDIAPSIGNTLILEFANNGFKSYWNGKTRRFMLKHLHEHPTFLRELNHGEHSDVKNYIFGLMLASETFALKKDSLIENSMIKRGIIDDFIRKNSEKESDFIFLRDLFRD